jgi:hypothetical protein
MRTSAGGVVLEPAGIILRVIASIWQEIRFLGVKDE